MKLILLAAFAAIGLAQTPTTAIPDYFNPGLGLVPTLQPVITGSHTATNCTVGSTPLLYDSGTYYVCTTTGTPGTFTALGTGGAGTVTSITCNNGLSGGVITSSGVCALDVTHANAWSGVQTFGANDVVITGLSGTSPVCPNGTGNALTTTGCSGGSGLGGQNCSTLTVTTNATTTTFASSQSCNKATITAATTITFNTPSNVSGEFILQIANSGPVSAPQITWAGSFLSGSCPTIIASSSSGVITTILLHWDNGGTQWICDETSSSSPSIILPGSSSGATAIQASATASGTLTLPAATDTLTGKATTDTFTNKTFDTGGTGNSFKVAGTAITALSGTGGTLCTSVGSACAGGGSYDPQDLTVKQFVDTWCTPANTGAVSAFGDLLWNKLAPSGTTTWATGGSNTDPCAPTLTTDTSSGTAGALTQVMPSIIPSTMTNTDFRLTLRLSDVTNVYTGLILGSSNGCNTTAGTCLAVYLDTTEGTTWRFIACNSFSCTETNSTITPANNTTYTLHMFVTTSGTWDFQVNSETPIAISTNLPASAVPPVIVWKNNNASAHTLTLLQYSMKITGLTQ